MKTVKFAIIITLLVTIALACILIFSAKYFAWRKKDGANDGRVFKIKIICLAYILAATIAIIILFAIK